MLNFLTHVKKHFNNDHFLYIKEIIQKFLTKLIVHILLKNFKMIGKLSIYLRRTSYFNISTNSIC